MLGSRCSCSFLPNEGLSKLNSCGTRMAVKCKHCLKNIPDKEVRSYVASLMGKTTGKSKARDPEKMRAAALKRWSGQAER